MLYEFRTIVTSPEGEVCIKYDQREISDKKKVLIYTRFLHKKYSRNTIFDINPKNKNTTTVIFKVIKGKVV